MPEKLSFSDYPNLDLADAGKLPNTGYGTVEGVRTHCISGGATALLTADITATQTSFDISDAVRYPATPFTIQIAAERMRVGAKSGNTLSSITRGYDGTEATTHGKGRTVFEVKTEYVYLLSPEPVKAVNQVYIDGVRQTSEFIAYTGRAGDEHPDFPGKAVIAFPAQANISKQRNLDDESNRQTEAIISAASRRDLSDETTVGIALSMKSNQKVWAAFTGSGTITGQTYTASIRNLKTDDGVIRAVVKDTLSSTIIKHEQVLIPGSTTGAIALTQEEGSWETEFSLLPYGYDGDFEVYYMKKTVTVVQPPENEAPESYAPPARLSSFRGAGIKDTPMLKPAGRVLAWVLYPSASHGTIDRQTHCAEIYNPGVDDAKVKLTAVEGGSALAVRELSIAAGATERISLTHQVGSWDAITKLVVISGEVRLDNLYKEVFYAPPDNGRTEAPLSTSSARVVIGKDITVDADWVPDESGDYGGLDTLIERPDQVIKHFIVKRMEFSLTDIDTESFNAAGSSYASAVTDGYRFAFVINKEIKPSGFLRRLAFECRSTIKYEKGRWYLNYLPDEAPSALKTVTEKELAGKHAKFRFSKTPVVEIANDLTARFKRSYTPALNDSQWLGLSMASDAASRTKYGTYPGEFEFEAIREQSMADDVLSHILTQRKSPLLTVEFSVFYEHFDLNIGDTIEIENPLYGGKKFYIENIRRIDKFRAGIKALEWW